MRKIYHDTEVIVWKRLVFNVPDDLSDSEIVDKIHYGELTPIEEPEYINGYKEYDGREEIFDDNENMLYSE